MTNLVTVTGSTGDQPQGAAILHRVRVGGTANLAGAVQIKRGSTVLETLPAASAPGTERVFEGLHFPANAQLQINLANAGDTVLVVRD